MSNTLFQNEGNSDVFSRQYLIIIIQHDSTFTPSLNPQIKGMQACFKIHLD